MDTLSFFGACLFFLLGAAFGFCTMYFGMLIIEWRIDHAWDSKKEG